jgi:hypothetical protein
MLRITSLPSLAVLAALVLAFGGCSGGGSPQMALPSQAQPGAAPASMVDTDTLANDVDPPDGPSILAQLNTETTIGSDVDPVTLDVNPYGLDIAPASSGLIHRGDLVVCDFNDSANVQGTGNAIIALAPVAGSSPRHITDSSTLLGCTENVQTNEGTIWVTAFQAPDVELVSPGGTLLSTLSGTPFNAPFGITLAKDDGAHGVKVFYESDVVDGTIVRIRVSPSGTTSEVIATGFAVNHGVPGTELGPGGLQYESQHDRLYVVDGANNTVVALRHVSTIPAGGITVNPNGTSFSGPFAHRGRLVFSGNPLNAPISSALFPNGNVAIGNTGNPNGFNLMVEITPHGKVAFVRNVDNGASGAIFGMTASGGRDVKLYFNDDNSNTTVVFTR